MGRPSNALIAEARQLFAEGVNRATIAIQLGVGRSTVNRWLSAMLPRHKVHNVGAHRQHRPNKDELEQRLREVPKDTRTPGEVAMGDPLPGRSALDRMRKV